MNVVVKKFKSRGEITAPPSKSYAHRYLIAAYLSGKKTAVYNAGDSDDVNATISCLRSFGAKIEKTENGVLIEKGGVPRGKVICDCGASGSTLRFLMPLAAALGVNAEFTGSDKLLSRPITELVNVLNAHGAKIDGFTVNGKIDGGVYEINASLSSQYVTGLIFALSATDKESEIIINGIAASRSYLDITADAVTAFGGKIFKTRSGYLVHGGYDSKIDKITVEGDWSGAAFPLAIGAVSGEVTVKNLILNSKQGDREIFKIFDKFGVFTKFSNSCATTRKSRMNGVTVDITDIPDLAQAIAAVAAFAEGETKIYPVSRLRLKESDRLDAIVNSLYSVGVKTELNGETLTIYGGGKLHGATIRADGDHRTVMAAAVLGAGIEDGVKIIGAEAVSKSYVNFFADLNALGCEVLYE